jgi:hypothetical protein
LKAVWAVYVPGDFVLLIDIGLHNAGWKFVRSGLGELQGVAGSTYCWANEFDTIAVVGPTANPDHRQVAEKIYADGKDRAKSDGLISLLDDLFNLVGAGLYSDLDFLMVSLDVSRVAPEYLVGILRATSKESRRIPHWSEFLSRVTTELYARKLDAAKILIGLA